MPYTFDQLMLLTRDQLKSLLRQATNHDGNIIGVLTHVQVCNMTNVSRNHPDLEGDCFNLETSSFFDNPLKIIVHNGRGTSLEGFQHALSFSDNRLLDETIHSRIPVPSLDIVRHGDEGHLTLGFDKTVRLPEGIYELDFFKFQMTALYLLYEFIAGINKD